MAGEYEDLLWQIDYGNTTTTPEDVLYQRDYVAPSTPPVQVYVGSEKKDWKVEVIDSGVLGGAVFPTLNPTDVPAKSLWDDMMEKFKSAAPKIGEGLDAWDFASNQLISTGAPPVMAAGALSKLGAAGAKGLLTVGKALSQAEKVSDVVRVSSKAEKVVGNFNPISKGPLPEAVANTFRCQRRR